MSFEDPESEAAAADGSQILDLLDSIESSLVAMPAAAPTSPSVEVAEAPVRLAPTPTRRFNSNAPEILPDEGSWGQSVAPPAPQLSAELRTYPDPPPQVAGVTARVRGSTADVLSTFKWG
jgi:hypothetical protein